MACVGGGYFVSIWVYDVYGYISGSFDDMAIILAGGLKRFEWSMRFLVIGHLVGWLLVTRTVSRGWIIQVMNGSQSDFCSMNYQDIVSFLLPFFIAISKAQHQSWIQNPRKKIYCYQGPISLVSSSTTLSLPKTNTLLCLVPTFYPSPLQLSAWRTTHLTSTTSGHAAIVVESMKSGSITSADTASILRARIVLGTTENRGRNGMGR